MKTKKFMRIPSACDDPNFRELSIDIDSQKNILKEELRMLEESIREFGKRGLVITSNR